MKKRKFIQNPINFLFKGILYPLAGWIFIAPLTLIFPPKKNRILFIGRSGGGFLDNVKYVFLYLTLMEKKNKELDENIELDYNYLTEDKNLYLDLKKKKLKVILFPRIKTFIFMMRSQLLIVDNVDWIQNNKFHFLLNTKKLQLWHGIFLKKIELDNLSIISSMNSKLMRIYYSLKGRFPNYDILLSPSGFYTQNVFTNSIPAKQIYESNYPRSDCLTGKENDLYFIGTDMAAKEQIEFYQKRGCKTVLYAPTFRDTGGDAISEKYLDINSLSDFGKKNHIVFVLKFHRWGTNDKSLILETTSSWENIIFYNNSMDIYPLLSGIDLLITDYSSIFLEYLVLNRAVLFFPYDYEKYIKKDRTMYFDYDKMTPGPKAKNFDELKYWVNHFIIEQKDGYEDQRKQVLTLTFKYSDGNASKRIIKRITEELKFQKE